MFFFFFLREGKGWEEGKISFYFRCEFAVLMKHPHEVNGLKSCKPAGMGLRKKCG